MGKKLIMSWSQVSLKDGVSTETKEMPADVDMSSPGVVNDKSTNLEASDGDSLIAKASGGVVVAEEVGEGGFSLTTRIKEPEFSLYEKYGLGSIDATSEDLNVKTHVVPGYVAVEVMPKNVGAIGLRAPYCSLSFKPGRSEDEGAFVDLTYKILPVLNDDYEVEHWYSMFRKKAAATPQE